MQAMQHKFHMQKVQIVQIYNHLLKKTCVYRILF